MGWADVDGGNRDGKVSLNEVKNYVQGALQDAGREQTVTLLAKPETDFVVGRAAAKDPPDVLALVSTGGSGGGGGAGPDFIFQSEVDVCTPAARAAAEAQRRERLTKEVQRLQAQVTAAWRGVSGKYEACAATSDGSARAGCAAEVERFLAQSRALTASVTGQTASATVAGQTCSAAVEGTSVLVNPQEVGEAEALLKRLTGEWMTHPVLGRLRKVPAGTYPMGSSSGDSDEKPEHQVTLSAYWIMETEVTQGMWRQVMGTNPSQFAGCDACPVEKVSWEEANAFARKVSGGGVVFRLPTEAEWEVAARGGQDHPYAGSSDVGAVAWYSANSDGKTHPVCGRAKNGYGLCDMSGNVWEWVSDGYGPYESGTVRSP